MKECLSRGRVKGIRGDRGKLRDEGAVGWGSLFAFVFSGLSGLGEERGSSKAGWGGESVWWRQCLAAAGSWSRWPNAVERERGRKLRTRVAVSWEIPRIYPRDRARRKVEISTGKGIN
jgi:hypothetical protein